MTGKIDPALKEAPYPFQAHLGFDLTAWDTGYARLELPLGDTLMNRGGVPHGGVYATLLDTAMGYAGCYTGDPDIRRLALTLSFTCNFMSRPRGSLLIAEGRKTGGGARTFFAEAVLQDETGERIATATGAFRYRGD